MVKDLTLTEVVGVLMNELRELCVCRRFIHEYSISSLLDYGNPNEEKEEMYQKIRKNHMNIYERNKQYLKRLEKALLSDEKNNFEYCRGEIKFDLEDAKKRGLVTVDEDKEAEEALHKAALVQRAEFKTENGKLKEENNELKDRINGLKRELYAMDSYVKGMKEGIKERTKGETK